MNEQNKNSSSIEYNSNRNKFLAKKLFLVALFLVVFGAKLNATTIIGANPNIKSVNDLADYKESDFWYPQPGELDPKTFNQKRDRLLNFVGVNGIDIKLLPLGHSTEKKAGDSLQSKLVFSLEKKYTERIVKTYVTKVYEKNGFFIVRADDTNKFKLKFGETLNIIGGKNISTLIDDDSKIKINLKDTLEDISSITSKDNNGLTITSGNKKYKFGGAEEGSSVITKKTLDERISNIKLTSPIITNILNEIEIDGHKTTLIGNDGNLTSEGKKYLYTNSASGRKIVENTNVIQAIGNINRQGTRFFHTNSGEIPKGKLDKKDNDDSSAGSIGSISIGMRADVRSDSENLIAIGTDSIVESESFGSVAIGDNSSIKGSTSVALGHLSTVSDDQGIAIGSNSLSDSSMASAIGVGSKVYHNYGISLGSFSVVDAYDGIAVGTRSRSEGKRSIAFGSRAYSIGNNSIALGRRSKSISENSVSLGSNSSTKGFNSVALGNEANVESEYGIALGSYSVADRPRKYIKEEISEKIIENSLGSVSVGNKDAQRQIINVAGGTEDTDAVNLRQLRASSIKFKADNGRRSEIKIEETIKITGDKEYIETEIEEKTDENDKDTLRVKFSDKFKEKLEKIVSYDTDDKTSITLGNGNNGVKISNLADGDISNRSNDAINGSQLYVSNKNIGDMLGVTVESGGKLKKEEFKNGEDSFLKAINKNHEDIKEGLGILDQFSKINDDISSKIKLNEEDIRKNEETLLKNNEDLEINDNAINELEKGLTSLENKIQNNKDNIELKVKEILKNQENETKNSEKIEIAENKIKEYDIKIKENQKGLKELNKKLTDNINLIEKNTELITNNTKGIKDNEKFLADNLEKINENVEKLKENEDKLNKNIQLSNENKGKIEKINNTLTEFSNSGMFSVKVDSTNKKIKINDIIEFGAGSNLSVKLDDKKITYSLNKNLKDIESITSENTPLTINSGGKSYKFGENGNDSVITKNTLEDKLSSYVTKDSDKTAKVTTDNNGIKVSTIENGSTTTYTLSLDESKIKELAGTTNLTDNLDKITNNLIDKGLKFDANIGGSKTTKLGDTINIAGHKDNKDATKFDSGKNIMTTINSKDGNTEILISLAKDLKDLESANFVDKTGKIKTNINQQGISTDGSIKILGSDGSEIVKLEAKPIVGKDGKTVESINQAINTLIQDLDKLDRFAVKYEEKEEGGKKVPNKESIFLGEKDKPVTIKNLKSGKISKDSNQAITGSQIYEFNSKLAEILGTKVKDDGTIDKITFKNGGTSLADAINKNHDAINKNSEEISKNTEMINNNDSAIKKIQGDLERNGKDVESINKSIKDNEDSINLNKKSIADNGKKIEDNKVLAENNKKLIDGINKDLEEKEKELINQKSEIEKNKQLIAGHSEKLKEHIESINQNKSDIEKNGTLIQTNKSNIDQNKKDIKLNSDLIKKNEEKIKLNDEKIIKNIADIDQNKKDIANNSKTILQHENLISENKGRTEENTKLIKRNEEKLVEQEAKITENSELSKKNAELIDVNKKLIEENQKAIKQNEKSIDEHSKSILDINDKLKNRDNELATIKKDIKENQEKITKNKEDIKSNKELIAKNDKEINKNSNFIKQNATDIAANKKIIEENKAKAQENANLIKTNKADIATNTKGILDNKSSISKIEGTLGDFKTKGLFKVKAGNQSTDIKVDDTVEFLAGHNLTVKNDGGKITYAMKDKPMFKDLTIGNVKLESGNNGLKLGSGGKATTIENVTSGINWTESNDLNPLYDSKTPDNVVTVKDLQKVATSGLNFSTDEGSAHKRLGEKLSIKGKEVSGHQNIKTSVNNGIELELNDDLKIKNSISASNTVISSDGLEFKNSGFKIKSDGTIEGFNESNENSIATVGYANRVRTGVNQGIASVSAMANIPQVNKNHYFSVGAGVGYYDGSKALAVGVSGQSESENLVYKASVGFDGTKTTVGAGFNLNIGDKKIVKDKEIEDLKGRISVLENYVSEMKKEEFKEKLYIIYQFDTDKFELSKMQLEKLKLIVDEINERYPDRTIDIVGHTDIVYTDKYSLDLGLKRANMIKAKMIELGLKNNNIRKVSSFGYNEKINSNELSSNRRVEIYIK